MRILSALAITLVLTLSSVALAADGAALYAKNCTSCHGADAKADTPAAKAMKVPAISGNAAPATISDVRENGKHAATSRKVSDEELKAIADYLAAL